jgi:hypothetical protein
MTYCFFNLSNLVNIIECFQFLIYDGLDFYKH